MPPWADRERIFNFTGEVALLGRSLDLGGGLDHGHVEVLATLRSRPLPPFTLASPTVAESLMAPHALRQLLCTDAVPIGAAPCCSFAAQVVDVAAGRGSRGAGLLLKNARSSKCRDVRGCSCVPIPSNASAAEPIKSKRRAFLPAGGAAERRHLF